MLLRHLRHRHPTQSWWTRWLLRRMSPAALAQAHVWEHKRYADRVGHDDNDLGA